MIKEALILFVRTPELGKVKTRLAATIGDDAALAVYQKLLLHTHSITAVLSCDKFVFYAGAVAERDMWSAVYNKQVQSGADLGERMAAAFAELFGKGYTRICIIGSDCFELTTSIIVQAFDALGSSDLVIGPARDGGYYLLGMRYNLRDVFTNIDWSTERVFEQTIARMRELHYTYTTLPLLTDVDTVDDVPKAWLD